MRGVGSKVLAVLWLTASALGSGCGESKHSTGAGATGGKSHAGGSSSAGRTTSGGAGGSTGSGASGSTGSGAGRSGVAGSDASSGAGGSAGSDARGGQGPSSGGASPNGGVAGSIAAGGSPEAGSGGASAGASGEDGGGGEATEVNREVPQWPMPNPPLTGLPHPMSYDASDPDVVLDQVTELMWERELQLPALTFEGAASRCEMLSLGGFDDWRVPTFVEAFSLVDWSRATPAMNPVVFPGIDEDTGPQWTATTFGAEAFFVDFLYANIGHALTGTTRIVRCVRAGAIAKDSGYALEAETLTNRATGLTWQRDASVTLGSQGSSVTHCDDLVLGGEADWRLPGIGELVTLVDPTVMDPSLSREAFPGEADISDQSYWAFDGWTLSFDNLYLLDVTAALHRTRCVH